MTIHQTASALHPIGIWLTIQITGATHSAGRYLRELPQFSWFADDEDETEFDLSNPLAQLRLYDERDQWEWYIFAYDAAEDLVLGVVYGLERDIGTFSLRELEEKNQRAGYEKIKWDSNFIPKNIRLINDEDRFNEKEFLRQMEERFGRAPP